jgi:hypothetical protein
MKRKITRILCAAGILGTLSAFPAMASEWVQAENGKWWYQYDDGSYPVSEWKTIDGKQYYFDGSGYMASNTIVDGIRIGINGYALVKTPTETSADTEQNEETGAVTAEESTTAAADDMTGDSEATAETADAVQNNESTITEEDDSLALKTLTALYKAVDDPSDVIIFNIRCQTYDYINVYRVRKHYRVCRIDYGDGFSDEGSRYVGYYESEVFTTTDTPVSKFGAKTIRTAVDSVDMDAADLSKRALAAIK